MAKRLFDNESLAWKPFGYVADVLLLSLIWVLCSIPAVTLGAASCAIYDSTVHGIRRGEREMYARFKRTFKAEMKHGIFSTLLWGVVIALYVLACRKLGAFVPEGKSSLVLEGVAVCLLALIVGTALWSFALQSRFTAPFGALQANAVRIALAHPIRTLAAGAAALAGAFITVRLVAPVIFLPGLAAVWCSYMFEPVIAKIKTSG